MYDVVLADPPWKYAGSQTKWGAAAKFYPLMSDDELHGLSIPLSDTGVLFCWTTGPMLERTMQCINAWGLTYRGVGFVWVKTKKSGEPIGAQGVRPSIIKPLTEFVLCASKVAQGRPMRLYNESVCQTVFAPRGEHSAKPDDVQARIEDLYPTATRLEMFARRPRDGWDAWGNEVDW